MAWFEVDIYNKSIEVDLHDYSHMTAIAISREKIKEAYDHGYKFIKLIHGATNIRDKNEGGSIKFALRAMLKRGELDRWVDRKSKNCRLDGGCLLLALRSNSAPVDSDWNEMPFHEY